MSTTEIIEILKNYNKWRRGDEEIEMIDPTILGIALDEAIKILKLT